MSERASPETPTRGCGDNSCVVEKPSGRGTNGGCRCPDWKLRAVIVALRSELLLAKAERRQAFIDGAVCWAGESRQRHMDMLHKMPPRASASITVQEIEADADAKFGPQSGNETK